MRTQEQRVRKYDNDRRTREATGKNRRPCPLCGYGCRGDRGLKLHVNRCPKKALA